MFNYSAIVGDVEVLPLRFTPPDGWRIPDPVFIALHQGEAFPADWRPYPEAPATEDHRSTTECDQNLGRHRVHQT